ncbi:hypothetical protein Taro_017196 [Colocasia esculenta]|uniref:Bromo domain-containing protein n=1 Tax=Colocasia esculenta TaxID=4460 RepID=A0A843UMH2_COLES|nr:hypothetical protein [Colocasia esculenta]
MVSESELVNLDKAPFKKFNLSSMSIAEKVALKKRLKSELSQVISAVDNIEAQLNRMLSHKFSVAMDNHQLLPGNDCPVTMQLPSCGYKDRQAPSCLKRKAADMHRKHIVNDGFSSIKEAVIVEKSESASVVTGAFKSESLQRSIREKSKGYKMDVSMSKQCMLILNKLMNHQFSWIFNQPVDPVKLNIPDYFSIISKPMDFGTIKHKLKTKVYLDVLDFAVDVRLTFSNAMRYNPPGNDVHIMAKELNNIFSLKWKALESKWGKERPHASQHSDVGKAHGGTHLSGVAIGKGSAGDQISLARNSLSSADRQKLRKDLAKISKRRVLPQLLCFFERFGFRPQNDGRIEVDIDEFDEAALLELYQLVRSCMNQGHSESQGLKNSCEHASVQDLCEGSASGDVPRVLWCNLQKPSLSSCSNGTCSNVNCHCNSQNDLTQSLLSGVDSERSERSSVGEGQKSPFNAYHLSDVDVTTGDQEGNFNHDIDGAEQSEGQLSPSKALRAAILKTRFADTILKAQHKTLLNNGEKGDPTKMQQEREKLKKKQQEERARLEAQVKAAEAAAQRKAAEELRSQREREREAARLALQKMEKTVDIDENREILKELEILGYAEPNQHVDLPDDMVVDFMDGFESQGAFGNPLEQLGLFIKRDDLDEEGEDDWIAASGGGAAEEGEIGLGGEELLLSQEEETALGLPSRFVAVAAMIA